MSNPSTPRSHTRRAAIAAGAAFILTGAAVSSVVAQQAAATAPVDDTLDAAPLTIAAPTPDGPGKDVFVFATGGGPADLEKRRDDWLNAVAGKLGVDKTKLQQAIEDATKDVGM